MSEGLDDGMHVPGDGAHRRLRESLGAWVLGALDGDERRRVEAHVASCGDCRDEVAALSPLPGLLQRVTATEVADSVLVPSPGMRERLAVRAAESEARALAEVSRWRRVAGAAVAVAAAAVIAIVAMLAAWPGDEPGPDRLVAPVTVVADDAATTGVAAAYAWEWGTTVELDVAALPARDAYRLWTVSAQGDREQAGTWGSTQSRAARVRGASSIQRADLELVEVTDPDGQVLVTFDFDDAVLEEGS